MAVCSRTAPTGRLRTGPVAGLAVATLLLPGCFLGKPAPQILPPTDLAPEPQQQPTTPPAAELSPESVLRDQNGRLELRLMEKQARIDELESQLVAIDNQLDQAIQEVVRTKAKLAGVESRAEAASELAEAEIALKALRARADARDAPESLQAERLLRMGTSEFQRSNYGGALFLTAQAKGQIRAASSRLDGQRAIELAEGETPFSLPVRLQLRTRSNLRRGPGLDFEIVATLEAGAAVTGYSYRGDWIRVESGDGAPGGWIHRELIVAP